MKEFNRVLVLAPHTDDGEIGCGGSISKFVEEGKEVFYAAFSICQKSVPKGWPPNILKKEVGDATRVLGIPKKNLFVYNYEVRTFPLHRQEILEDLIKLKTRLKPDLIFLPSPNDLHQDHKTIAEEGIRAFKLFTILGYEEPWNNISFKTRTFIPLEKKHINKKIKALKCYRTQYSRKYLDDGFVWGLARTRGTQIEGKYAEAFEVLRWIIR